MVNLYLQDYPHLLTSPFCFLFTTDVKQPFCWVPILPLGTPSSISHLQLWESNTLGCLSYLASSDWVPSPGLYSYEGILLGDHLLAYRTEPSLNLLAMLLFLPRQHILDCLGEWCVLWGSFGLTKYIHSSIFTSHSLSIPPSIVSPRSSGISTLLRVGN